MLVGLEQDAAIRFGELAAQQDVLEMEEAGKLTQRVNRGQAARAHLCVAGRRDAKDRQCESDRAHHDSLYFAHPDAGDDHGEGRKEQPAGNHAHGPFVEEGDQPECFSVVGRREQVPAEERRVQDACQ